MVGKLNVHVLYESELKRIMYVLLCLDYYFLLAERMLWEDKKKMIYSTWDHTVSCHRWTKKNYCGFTGAERTFLRLHLCCVLSNHIFLRKIYSKENIVVPYFYDILTSFLTAVYTWKIISNSYSEMSIVWLSILEDPHVFELLEICSFKLHTLKAVRKDLISQYLKTIAKLQ